jgi:serine/threonine-protein kinase RsbW
MMDPGRSFDPQLLDSPELQELAESGMGLFIIKSLMDEVEYRPGNPNVLSLCKRRKDSSTATNEACSERNSTP